MEEGKKNNNTDIDRLIDLERYKDKKHTDNKEIWKTKSKR